MKQCTHNSLIAILGGLLAVSVLSILSYLIFDVADIGKPFPATPFGIFLHYLILVALLEEGIKFLLIKKNIGKYPYGFLLGFGFGVGEVLFKYSMPEWWRGTGCILLHTITAGIIVYFIMKKKPVLGLVIVVLIHLAYNYLVL
jgi:RsiW-degrading membrane proteinase PrsW (M82 family)